MDWCAGFSLVKWKLVFTVQSLDSWIGHNALLIIWVNIYFHLPKGLFMAKIYSSSKYCKWINTKAFLCSRGGWLAGWLTDQKFKPALILQVLLCKKNCLNEIEEAHTESLKNKQCDVKRRAAELIIKYIHTWLLPKQKLGFFHAHRNSTHAWLNGWLATLNLSFPLQQARARTHAAALDGAILLLFSSSSEWVRLCLSLSPVSVATASLNTFGHCCHTFAKRKREG